MLLCIKIARDELQERIVKKKLVKMTNGNTFLFWSLIKIGPSHLLLESLLLFTKTIEIEIFSRRILLLKFFYCRCVSRKI